MSLNVFVMDVPAVAPFTTCHCMGVFITQAALKETAIQQHLLSIHQENAASFGAEQYSFSHFTDDKRRREQIGHMVHRDAKGIFIYAFEEIAAPLPPDTRTAQLLQFLLHPMVAGLLATAGFVTIHLPVIPRWGQEVRADFASRLRQVLHALQPQRRGRKTYYPHIHWEIGSHGYLQGGPMIQYMLWAVLQAQGGDATWLHALPVTRSELFTDGHDLLTQLHLQCDASAFQQRYLRHLIPTLKDDQYIAGLLIVERFFWHLRMEQLHLYCEHLKADCAHILNLLRVSQPALTVELLTLMTATFLQLFDNLPVYPPTDRVPEDEYWQDLLLAKQTCIHAIVERVAFEKVMETYNHWRAKVYVRHYQEWRRAMDMDRPW
jgi:hypothetical protein